MNKTIARPVAVPAMTQAKQPSFAERLMKLNAKGAKVLTPFQRDPAHKRFNAYGCQ
jgi:hypothetical protein